MKNAHRLTQGAVLLAVFAVLLLISLYVPFLGLVSIWFLPLPFIYIAWKNDLKGIVVFFVASIFLSFIVGTLFAIPMTFLFGATGIALGYLVQKNKSRTAILMISSLVFLMITLILYGAAVTLFKFNFIAEATSMLKQAYDASFEILNATGQASEANKLKERLDEMLKLIGTLLPSLFVVGSFINVFLLQLFNFSILKRFGMNLSHWKPFRELSLPKSILWYYLITAILTLLLKPDEGSYLYTALWNLAYVLQILLVIQGLSLVYFISELKGWAKAIPIIATVFALLLPIILYIIRILGIIDLGFDLRKRLKK
ncbi:MAG TPA: YybS family protein [Pseudoneobacillus sp.]|nr:YybS family protein [Pseudoneobacillus sp.]